MTLVETDVLEEMKSRLDLTEEVRPPTPSSLTTLRIKAETGEHVSTSPPPPPPPLPP